MAVTHWYFIIVLIWLTGILPTCQVLSQEAEVRDLDVQLVWERQIRGFRRDHQFTLTSGFGESAWHIADLGSLKSRRVTSVNSMTRVGYAYFVQTSPCCGYFLGSAVGYVGELQGVRRQIRLRPAVIFPGVAVGLAYNLSWQTQLSFGLDYNLQRVDDLSEHDGVVTEISISMERLSTYFAYDWFLDLNWGLRVEGHLDFARFEPPRSPQGTDLDARITSASYWVGLGLTYHLI